MGLQEVKITFKKRAEKTKNLLARGTVAIILKQQESETPVAELFKFKNKEEAERVLKEKTITLTEDSKKCLDLAFRGNISSPYEVIVGIAKNDDTDFDTVLDLFNTVQFEFLCAPEHATAKGTNLKTFIEEYNKKGEAQVVGTTTADLEYFINFGTDNIIVTEIAGEKNVKLSKDLFTARVASYFAGTPLTQSITNYVLSDVESIPARSKSELDADIEAGKLVLFTDWEKVRFGRAVNSLTNIKEKSEELKKISTVSKMNIIKKQIKEIVNERYIGKVPNTIDGKMLLITSINEYFLELERIGILHANESSIDIDLAAQRKFLNEHGVDVDSMSEKEIRSANTSTFVFLEANLRFADAMEDVFIEINY